MALGPLDLAPTVTTVKPEIVYRSAFRFAVTPSALWDAIEHTEWFEGWWPWLHEFSLEGGALVTGSVLHGVVTPPLPYRMNVDVELLRCDRPREIDAAVHGDLEGTAELRLREEGPGTIAEVAWTLEMMQRPMRVASRVAHPVLRMGHDAVVRMTVASFRRHLRETISERS